MNQRAMEKITVADLARLSNIARADRDEFFKKYPRYAPYQSKVACVALC
jgi:hypothetical protein